MESAARQLPSQRAHALTPSRFNPEPPTLIQNPKSRIQNRERCIAGNLEGSKITNRHLTTFTSPQVAAADERLDL